jgi:hypothetical protein
VSKPIVENLAFSRGDHLGDAGESPEGGRVHDSITVPLRWRPLIVPRTIGEIPTFVAGWRLADRESRGFVSPSRLAAQTDA